MAQKLWLKLNIKTHASKVSPELYVKRKEKNEFTKTTKAETLCRRYHTAHENCGLCVGFW